MDDRQENLRKKQHTGIENRLKWVRQAVSFGMVGILNTAVDFLVFLILTHFFSVFYAASQVLSYGAGMLNSYLWNSKVTFAHSSASRSRIFKFILLNVSVLLLTLALMHSLLFLPIYLNKAISTFVGLGFNFILSKLWVFRG